MTRINLQTKGLTKEQLLELDDQDLIALHWAVDWRTKARSKQLSPPGDWTIWGVLAGRGFGKTLTGAQWLGWEAYSDKDALPRAVIAPTFNDVRHTCFEGPAGLLKVIPHQLIHDYNKSNLIITLINGATIRGFSAEEPERLRGPQHSDIWADELAAWQYLQETWDMAMMGLRLGSHPRILFTTTPKPRDLIRNLVETKGAVIVRGSTYENRANLPKTFFDQLAQYEGTALGRQELNGELIDPEESGIIKRSWMKLWPNKKPLPSFEWIVMSLDTAFTEATTDKKTHESDCSACTVWGTFFHDGRSNVMLLDAWQDRLGLPDLMARVKKELNVAYGDDKDTALIKPMFGSAKLATTGRKPDILIIEDKGSGISLRQMLEREGIEAYAYNPGRADKLTRLHMVSSIFARNQVWLPESGKFPKKPMTWCNDMLDQLCTFTGSGSIKHDDFVDSVTQAIRLMMDKNLLSAVKKSNMEYDRPPSRPVVNPYAS